jgi:hypothetical protein
MRNFLVEGLSGTRKASVCKELRLRGYPAINGDTELAYQGDPQTGAPTHGRRHENHLWDVRRLRALIADQDDRLTFFCGGSRNFSKFIDLFDGVFVLEIDLETLEQRLAQRAGDEWGVQRSERDLTLRLHRTGQGIPNGIAIDAAAPLANVVDEDERPRQPSNAAAHPLQRRLGSGRPSPDERQPDAVYNLQYTPL